MDIHVPSHRSPCHHQGDHWGIDSRIHILLSTGIIETNKNHGSSQSLMIPFHCIIIYFSRTRDIEINGKSVSVGFNQILKIPWEQELQLDF